MATYAVIHTDIDAQIEADARVVFEAMGLTTSDAVRLMMTQIAKEKILQFDISDIGSIAANAKGLPLTLLSVLKNQPLPESSKRSDVDIDAQIIAISESLE